MAHAVDEVLATLVESGTVGVLDLLILHQGDRGVADVFELDHLEEVVAHGVDRRMDRRDDRRDRRRGR